VSRPRLPLTEFERKKLDKAQSVAVVALLVGLVAATLVAWLGEVRFALIALAVPVAYLAAVLVTPLRIFWLSILLYALAPALAGYLLGYPVLGVVAGVAVAGWIVLGAMRGLRAVPATIRPLEAVTVDLEATEHVAAFETLGFEPVGAYAFDPEPGRSVVVTVLLGPDGDQYVLVTDLVLDVVSIFGSRLFITANSAVASLPPEYLSNTLRGAEPDEIVRVHRRGLELLAAQGLAPDSIDREGLLETQVELERRCGDWALRDRRGRMLQSLFASGLGSGPLDETPSSRERIDAWLGAASPVLAAATS
jgi:hypothetical protein